MVSHSSSKRPLKKKRSTPLAKVVALRRKRSAPPPPPLKNLSTSEIEEAFARMATCMADSDSVTEAQREQLSVIQDFLKAKACFVASFIASKNQLQVSGVRGRNDARILAAKPGEGALGRAFEKGGVERDKGVIAAPIRGPHGVLGCLAVIDSRAVASDDLMRALTAQMYAAMEVARLRDETVRRNKDLQTAVSGLKSLEKNREDMLAHVSHDLKNPLTTVKAYLAMLSRGKLGPINDGQLRALQTCDRNADRLLRMINDLVLISRLQSGKMQLSERPIGLKAIADEVLQSLSSLAEYAKVRLVLKPSTEVFVRGDKARLAEAFYNLIDYAIHHTQAEGSVETLIEAADAGVAMITVRNQGNGMSPEDLAHAFEAYHRTTNSSNARASITGLSLPIVSKIVQLHGGSIVAQSIPNEGSTFRIHLPMFAGAISPTALARPPKSGGILLVEDDADCREVLVKLLEQEDYRVIPASTAATARKYLENIIPAMVLLDLRLSNEDGRSVLHHIRRNPDLNEVPVFIISGASDVGTLAAGKGLDRIDGYFEKPLQLGKLLDTVASVARPTGRMITEG